jgi:hypothetical protein
MSLLNQIRSLQIQGESFALELSSGRIVQVYDPFNVATLEGSGPRKSNDLILVLHCGGFDLLMADQIAAVSAGIHSEESARNKQRMEEIRAQYGWASNC